MALSFDSKTLVSVQEGVLNVWTINYQEFEESIAKDPLSNPYLHLLETTAVNGQSKRKEIDFLYYLQLKRQGEQVTAPRQVSTVIPIEDIPLLMQAMGYYE
jgi:hypothetical protein